ncbi:hypothetical protein MLD38_009268 [Melastoma candidum]|uniref:Uncharacterized protein n=1 Tax=Melastoma candidum TaxID=119954 RepID=A0ACB9RWF4_9MYRT|nr:hypothetical protein MLD38_009268 [Melastoma candidum]
MRYQDYIVYMGKLPDSMASLGSDHVGLISRVVEESHVSTALSRSYRRSFNGFAAKLTQEEASRFAGIQGVVSVFPDIQLQLHTTRSWDFLGLNLTSPRKPTIESDIIIGVIDSGIWPESESFKDEGFGPPPKKWKGACNGGANFTCNNKLIGARYYMESSARDSIGHGSHTASIAAGDVVRNASFFGLAEGTVRGGVPSARIVVYKVCNDKQCSTSGILAAFDDAIADGVDIITVSLGSQRAMHIDEDIIAIGSFHAMEKGILTTQSAGNSGDNWSAIISTAPWLFSIAASSIDRKFFDTIALEGGPTFTGLSINSFPTTETYLSLVYGLEAGNKWCPEDALKKCQCLEKEKVSGKILLCDDHLIGQTAAAELGAAGVVLPTVLLDTGYIYAVPSSVLNSTSHDILTSYHERTKNPRTKLFKSETIDDLSAPLVASFSSRGPNAIIPDIMKPDVSAPGIDILAAFSPEIPPSRYQGDPRRVPYTIFSGTSMACPHVAGVAAYVKSFHPNWSPSAIKSAIMTTARPMRQNQSDEFSYGSGQVDPIRAVSPGLVYEIRKDDYSKLLCTLHINATLISGGNISCSGSPELNARDMNYPSIVLSVDNHAPVSFNVTRTVTNVGSPNSTYTATLSVHTKVNAEVVPKVLHFDSRDQTRSFTVSVTVSTPMQPREVLSSSLVWSDGSCDVRSPIVVYRFLAAFPPVRPFVMGKSDKKSVTKVTAAAAVPPIKSAKKGKREAEDALEKQAGAKKQKLVAAKEEASQKKKAEVKQQVEQKKKKDETSSSEEESDSSEDEKMVKQVAKKPQVVVKPASKESSSDESSSDEEPTVASNKGKSATLVSKSQAADDSDSSDSSEDDSDDAKGANVKTAPAIKNVPKKKAESSSSDDSSDEDEKSVPAKQVLKQATVAKSNGSSKKDESSDSSEEESSDSDNGKVKKVAVASKGASKKDESSDDSSDESDSDLEEDASAKKPVAKSSKEVESEDTSSESESEDEAPAKKNVVVAKQLHEKKMDIDDSESDDDSSDDDEPQSKKSKVSSKDTKPNGNAARKESGSEKSSEESEESSDDEPKIVKKPAEASSDESEEESSSESEDEKPIDVKKKWTDVEMVDASPVTAQKPAAPKHDKNATTPLSGETKTVYVGNLPYSAEKSDLEAFFKDVGEIVDVHFSVAPEDGRRKGFGHVEFASAEQAQKAVELNGEFLNGRQLKIDLARGRGSYTPGSKQGNYSSYRDGQPEFAGKAFVRGFDTSGGFDQIRATLEEQFSACGEVSKIAIPKDFESGEPKGVAFVYFKDTDGFNKALELNGADLGGYSLVVEEASA